MRLVLTSRWDAVCPLAVDRRSRRGAPHPPAVLGTTRGCQTGTPSRPIHHTPTLGPAAGVLVPSCIQLGVSLPLNPGLLACTLPGCVAPMPLSSPSHHPAPCVAMPDFPFPFSRTSPHSPGTQKNHFPSPRLRDSARGSDPNAPRAPPDLWKTAPDLVTAHLL